MRSYPWFRLFSEARTDAKLRTLSDAEHRVWFGLLCMAAEQPQRGTITGRTDEVLALEVSGGDVALLRQTVTRLVQLQILSDGGADGITFVHFRDRQHDYPSDLPEATRARKQAQRSRVVTSVSRDVTSGHEGEEKRIEKNREEEKKDHDRSEGGESERGESRTAPQSEKPAVEASSREKRNVDAGSRVEAVLIDLAWIAKAKALRPQIPWDDFLADGVTTHFAYLVEQWRDGVRTKPPKGNYKNSLSNWMDNYRPPGERNGQHPNPAHRTTSHPASATELAGWARKTGQAPG